MKRSIETKLVNWKNNPNKKPLIIFGPRQVGKTYICNKFAKDEYQFHFYFNLINEPELTSIARNNRGSIKELLNYLKNVVGFEPSNKNHILIIDEAQEAIEIFAKMKTWNENDKILNNVILTGSWIDVSIIESSNYFAPVGQVEILKMFPMTFEEFLWNHQDWKKFNFFINKTIKEKSPIEKSINKELLKIFEEYMFVGGMPEIVKHHFEENDKNYIREKQGIILEQYANDLQRISKKVSSIKINQIFDGMAFNLHKTYDNKSNRFRYTSIKKSARKREYEEILELLILSRIAYKINVLENPTEPFVLAKKNIFKLYFIDVGLLANKIDYKNILESKISYKGYAIENYVASQLSSLDIDTAFWEQRINNKNYEMDFLVKNNYKTYAIDVKTSKGKMSSSMKMITKRYKIKNTITITSQNFLIKNWDKVNVINIPFYLLPWIKKII